MENGIESIFDKVPLDESSTKDAPKESSKDHKYKEMGDRVANGDTNARIEAFGEMLGDDDYGGKPKEHEPVKVEKDKIAPAPKDATKKEEAAPEEEEVLEEEEAPSEEITEEQVDPEKLLEKVKDLKIKVKVDGKFEEKTLQELKDSYSSRVVNGRTANELHKEKQVFQKEKQQVIAEREFMQNEVKELKGSFQGIIEQFQKDGFITKNPLAAVESLLDKLGIDSYAFNRAAFEYNLPEYEKFFEMSDIERDAYFTKKENEFFRKKESTLAERTKQAQAVTERQAQEFNLIKSSGLSIDQYNEHFDELEALGSEDLSTETVLQFAKVKPVFDKAGGIVSKTSKAGDIALIQQVSALLLEFPSTTEEEIIENIEGKAQAKKAAQVLKDKENFTVKKDIKKSPKDGAFFTEDEMREFNEIRRN